MKPYLLVERQVPEFVRAEYPAFLEFLTAYYKWLEEEASVGKLENVVNVDQTVDGFLQYFRKQIDLYGITPEQTGTLYLRNIKQLYAAKGSEAGYEFLLKILYNKTSSVIHPWDYVFKPSAGKWKQDVTVIVSALKGTLASLGGNPVVLTDSQGNVYNSFAKNVIRRKDGNVELVVGRIPHTSTLKSVASTDGSITGTVLNTTVSAKVERAGEGFRVGQVFRIASYGGSGTLLKVKAVNSTGGITAVEIITFGTGYVADFNILISPTGFVDLGTVGPKITLGGLTYANDNTANAQNESGSIVKHDYTLGTYVVDPSYVGETLGEIRSQEATVYTANNYASIKFTVGSQCVYPGFYESSESIIGDLTYIQDSFYYQAFSYVTVIDEALDSYSAILRDVLHPAGTKHFGNYAILNQFDLSLVVDPSLNLINKKDAIRDFVTTVEQIVFAFTKILADTATATETFNRVATFVRTYTDSTSGVTHNVPAFDMTTTRQDSVTMTELISLIPGFVSTDSFVVADALAAFVTNKYPSDPVQTGFGDNSGLYMEPYYVEVSNPAPYWQAGYLENERTFTN